MNLTVIAVVSFEFNGLVIEGKTFTMSTPVTGLTNAQSADVAVTAEIAKYIADVATALQNAINNGDNAAVQAIADDLNKDSATLTAADPLNPPATPTA
jgi:hypothetical protein